MKKTLRTSEIFPGRWRLPSSRPMSPVFWLPLSALLSFALTWRLFFLPMVSDEGGYAYAAQHWFDGSGSLYHDVWISRPQAIFVVYGAVIDGFGGSTAQFRFAAWLTSLVTMVCVWGLTSRWRGSREAALATVVFAILIGSPATEGFTANAEAFMALPAALSVWTLWIAFQRDWSRRWLLATGLLIGLAAQLKPSGATMLPMAIGFVAIMLPAGLHYRRHLMAGSAWVMTGLLASLAPALYHGYLVGFHDFVFAAIGYRATHQSSATSSLHHHIQALSMLSGRIWPAYLVIAAIWLIRGWSDPDQRDNRGRVPRLRPQPVLGIAQLPRQLRTDDPARRLLQLWLIACLVGISMGGDWWYHYLIQIAAPFAIWLAINLSDIRKRLTPNLHLVLVVATILMLLTPYTVLARSNRAAMTNALFGHPGYADQEAVANYLRDNTAPGTPIFVAFDQAALYYLSDRPSPYRYLYDQELRAFPSAEDALIAMVEGEGRPELIVGTRQLAPFADRGLAFWEAVQRHYTLETVIRGVPIYRAKSDPALPS